MTKEVKLDVRTSKTTKARLKKLAVIEDRSVAYIVEQCLKGHLPVLEAKAGLNSADAGSSEDKPSSDPPDAVNRVRPAPGGATRRQ